jgi:RHS repeat-associated protein
MVYSFITDDLAMAANPVLEANSYYPMGLPMAVLSKISSTVHNRYGYQGKEMQNQEWTDGSGLNAYDFEARMYDPQLGVWHNQDPAGQYASPYMAMGDNWVNGIDPNGKSFFGGILKGLWNSVKITAGLFAFNKHETVFANLFGLVKRFTWELPQEAVGYVAAEGENAMGMVDNVSYFDGTTVLHENNLASEWDRGGQAFTIGNFINGPDDITTSPNDRILQHEYGRYLQSQADGLAYLPFTAIPDLINSMGDKNNLFILNKPTDWDGNARALKYFNEYYGGIYSSTANPDGKVIWNFNITNGNPIHGYDPTKLITDPVNQAALNNAMRRPSFVDVLSGAFIPALPFWLDAISNIKDDSPVVPPATKYKTL